MLQRGSTFTGVEYICDFEHVFAYSSVEVETLHVLASLTCSPQAEFASSVTDDVDTVLLSK